MSKTFRFSPEQKVRHDDFINLRGVKVGPGERGSRYTLNIESDTAAVIYR